MKYLVAGAIVVALGVIQPAATLAAPSCDGHPATMVGTAGADEIGGTSRSDVIVALGGDDVVFGLAGADIICGGRGNDELLGGKGDDVLRGDDGRDYLQGEQGRDVLVGQVGHDRLEGGPGGDRVFGNGGEDRLYGNPGEDRLEGGYARDYLNGGADDDGLDGGPGPDACLQASGSGRLTGCENNYADLAIVAVDCPDSATLDVPFECKVTVINHGPGPAHYVLGNVPFPKDCHGSCAINALYGSTGHDVNHPDAGALLAVGDERTDTIEVTIRRWPGDQSIQAWVVIRIRPIDVFDAIDTTASNDVASTPIEQA